MWRNGTWREDATFVSENGGSVVVGTDRAVKMSPEEGVEGKGEEELPC